MISAILFVVSPRLRSHKHHHPAPLDSILHLESRESTLSWFSNSDVSDEATVRTVLGENSEALISPWLIDLEKG